MRFILISVEDDKVSDQFIEDMKQVETHGVPFVPQGAAVIGMFQVPTKFCDPTDGHRGKKTEAGWTRGRKYGWWVCGKCKKPSAQWGWNLNGLLSSARNLLEDNGILGAARAVDVTLERTSTKTWPETVKD